MQTIVFIGANKSGTSRLAIKTAEMMGYFTVLFTNRQKFIEQRGDFPDVHEMIYSENLSDKRWILKQMAELRKRGKEIKACLSFIDPFVHLAAGIAEQMGLEKVSKEALFLMEDKTRFRETLKSHPATPFFTVYHHDKPTIQFAEGLRNRLPVILKTPVSNGSKDVILVDTVEKCKQGIQSLQKRFLKKPILIEEYLDGPQFLVEVMAYKGEIFLIGVVEQFIKNLNRFIVTGYLHPARLSDDQYHLLGDTVESILQSLHFSHGTCHLELRFVAGKWKLIELNPRMSGGAMNRIIYEGNGIHLVKETLRLHLGIAPSLAKTKNKHVYAHFLTIQSKGKLLKVTGKKRASKYEGVKEVFVKPRKGNIVTEPHSMGDRYAYVIASADSAVEAIRIAYTAAKEIKFYIEPIEGG